MKKGLTTCLLLTFAITTPLFGIWMPNDIKVSSDSPSDTNYLSGNAWCVAAFDSTVHGVWYDHGQDIYYRRSTNGGLQWDSTQVLTHSADDSMYQYPSIAVVADTVHIVYYADEWNGTHQLKNIMYRRNDTAGTGKWSTPLMLSDTTVSYPCIAAQDSQVHVVWRNTRAHPYKIRYKRWNGSSWESTRTLDADDSAEDLVIATQGRFVYVVWRQTDGIYYICNTNYGDASAWDSTSFHLVNDNTAYHPSVATCQRGESDSFWVYVTWHAYDGTNYRIYYTRSVTGGNWEDSTLVSDSTTSNRYPSVAALDGYGHVVWCEAVPESSKVMHKKVPSQLEPVRISQTIGGKTTPTINAYGDTLHVVWLSEQPPQNFHVYYNRYTPMYTPQAPYISQVEKSADDVVLTWNKITEDTLGNPSTVDYYVVYRDTSPSLPPSADDSLASVTHPETTFTDIDALDAKEDYYYLVKAVDTNGSKSKKSNMGYKLYKFYNENTGNTDKNWVSLPWHSEYSDVSDLTDDLSPRGDPLIKISNLRDDQLYENWLWDDLFLQWTGIDFDIQQGRGYEMITIEDTTLFLVGSNNPDGLIALNENPGTTDKNWVSIPYNAAYSIVSDITDEYSPVDTPLVKITNLRDDQLFESWVWDDLFLEWTGENFDIIPGRGYEFITIVDTTWNPTEYAAGKSFMAGNRNQQVLAKTILGSSTEPDRVPAWIVDHSSNGQTRETVITREKDSQRTALYRLNAAEEHTAADHLSSDHSVEATDIYGDKGGPGASPDDRKISHTVRSYLTDARGFENFAFTTYRVDLPEDVLTEMMVGSATATNQQLGVIWFDAGNFRIPWKHGQEGVLIIEATKNEQPYYDVIDYVLDEKVDIQRLKDIKLTPVPDPGSSSFSSTVLSRSIGENDNIIGYSLYRDGKRLNSTVLQEVRSVADNANLRLVVRGGHETVYGSDGIQSKPDKEIPISFTFSIAPNPFVKRVKVDYAIPNQTHVDAAVYDVSGRQVKTVLFGEHPAGYYSVIWDGTDDIGRKLPSGIYFIKFEAGQHSVQDKILLIR